MNIESAINSLSVWRFAMIATLLLFVPGFIGLIILALSNNPKLFDNVIFPFGMMTFLGGIGLWWISNVPKPRPN